MKITDLAIFFVIVLLPFSFIIRYNSMVKNETLFFGDKYNNMIDTALTDGAFAMKMVQTNDIDYGYDIGSSKKIKINPQLGINTFLDSMFYTMNIKGDTSAEERIKSYIPAIAVIDYDGLYIYSAEEYNTPSEGNVVKHKLKPKIFYTYKDVNANIIGFTLDNYIYITTPQGKLFEGYMPYSSGPNNDFQNEFKDILNNPANNINLEGKLKNYNFINGLPDINCDFELIRKNTIIQIIKEELACNINKHAKYAAKYGITYSFSLPTIKTDNWQNTIQDVGILAFFQGMDMGNQVYNYYAFGGSKLFVRTNYYATADENSNLYHKMWCPRVKRNPLGELINVIQEFLSKKDAASMGFSPCDVCKP